MTRRHADTDRTTGRRRNADRPDAPTSTALLQRERERSRVWFRI